MRFGDFAVEVIPHGEGKVRELESGQVLARPGQVYVLRLRNLGPLHCVVNVDVDGHRVTAGGLVLAPWSTTDLERPIDAREDGRFTVIPEGDEAVFGPDGGRDDEKLGLIVASFRRELPWRDQRLDLPPTITAEPPARPLPDVPSPPRRFPVPIPEWAPPLNRVDALYEARDHFDRAPVERAAGTGLTGHSDQQFVPMTLGPLESEPTVIKLRIVIGSEQAIAEEPVRPLVERDAPARPAARP